MKSSISFLVLLFSLKSTIFVDIKNYQNLIFKLDNEKINCCIIIHFLGNLHH